MQSDQKAVLKNRIMDKIVSLKKGIASFTELTKPISPDNAIGRITRMEAINSKSINEAALNKAENSLVQLERALAMIDDPDFGLCRECEEPIPVARLMILPETKFCVKCAQNMDG